MFRDALKANKSLWLIDLSNIDLDFYGIELLANALEYNQSLKEVNLSGNNIGGGNANIFVANVLSVTVHPFYGVSCCFEFCVVIGAFVTFGRFFGFRWILSSDVWILS